MKGKDLNPYQTLHRLRTKAIRAVDDLILIAQRLPDETQTEIFNFKNIRKLASTVLGENDPPFDNPGIHDSRRLQLAALLVEIGIRVCIKEYQTKIEQDSVLNDLNVSHLSRARDICNAISFKARLPQLEKEAEKEDLIYLFNWNRINDVHETRIEHVEGEDTKRFKEFLQDIALRELGVPIDVINTINYAPDSHDWHLGVEAEKIFEYTDIYGGHVEGMIWLNSKDNTGHLSMKIRGEEEELILQPDLVIKIENENVYVCRKRGSASKLVTQTKK